MNICDHFKLVIAGLAGVLAGKFLHIPVLMYVIVAGVYAIYSHKDAIIGIFKK